MSGIVQGLLASFSSAAAVVTDAYFYLVTLLLNTTTTNGAQNNTFLDSSTNNFTITRNGNTTQGTFTPFSQTGWSNYFDGTSAYLTSNQSAYTAAGDFTCEAWVYGSVGNAYQGIISTRSSGNNNGYAINLTSGGNLEYWINTVNYASTALPLNQWNHVAMVRSGTGTNNVSCYLNGTRVGQFTSTATTSNTNLIIGRYYYDGTNQYWLTGYVSNARVAIGAVVYSGTTYTVPTAPLGTTSGGTNPPTGTQTALLTCQSNRFVDNSSNAFALTIGGTPSVQAFSPFAPTTAYSTTTVGGSGIFNPTGTSTDYLSIANNAAIQIGATYTIEGWFYPTSTSEMRYFGKFTAGTGGWLLLALNTSYVWYYANAGSTTLSGSWSPKINAWNHIAISANSTAMRIWLNGVSINNVSSPTATQDDGNSLLIGNYNGTGGIPFIGYISGFRIVKGSVVYDPTSTTITVPTAPPTAVTNTQLLLNYTNAGIYDATAKNDLQTVGSAQVSTTQAKFGTTSMSFNGTTSCLSLPNSTNWDVGSGSYTIEFFVYMNNLTTGQTFIARANSGSIYATFDIGWYASSLKLYVSNNGSSNAVALTSSISPTATTWTHIAVTRNGSTYTIWVNGVSGGTATDSGSAVANGNSLGIGGYANATSLLNGYIDELRITKGYARYTTTFTPPTAAFPVQ